MYIIYLILYNLFIFFLGEVSKNQTVFHYTSISSRKCTDLSCEKDVKINFEEVIDNFEHRLDLMKKNYYLNNINNKLYIYI